MAVCGFYGITLSEALRLPDAEINAALEYLALRRFIENHIRDKDFAERLKELK